MLGRADVCGRGCGSRRCAPVHDEAERRLLWLMAAVLVVLSVQARSALVCIRLRYVRLWIAHETQ